MAPVKNIFKAFSSEGSFSEVAFSSHYDKRPVYLSVLVCFLFSGVLRAEATETDPTDLKLLHDIVVPESVSFFPLAAAWWIILTLLAIVSLAVAWKCFLRWHCNAYRRAALREYYGLRGRKNPEIREYNVLLKRTAMAAFGRKPSAGIFGEDWIRFLEAHVAFPVPDTVRSVLVDDLFSKQTDSGDCKGFSDFVERWIKEHKQK